ncbi:L,D-transpeptidase [Salinarimonas soli]|uniref:L,D-transpeptidase n=1 Tax=Salinarimonas soli TaxID=1638099 RepID=A0A5B2VHA7_9HYPH|nr:L,D-transpeptidase [Salinarimonas soli]KAA2237926.1 L,D-transpeptidase [Salinarimonas soli]
MRKRIVAAALWAAMMACAGKPAQAREMVPFGAGVQPGTIVVKTGERRLYLVLGDGRALRYPVAVGQPDKQWFGWSAVDGKYVNPAWSPPDVVKRDNPRLPDLIPGGSPRNPMGVRALTLTGGEYAIHGTNNPKSIGRFASYGCIRMFNEDIVDLFERVGVGTPVVVIR